MVTPALVALLVQRWAGAASPVRCRAGAGALMPARRAGAAAELR